MSLPAPTPQESIATLKNWLPANVYETLQSEFRIWNVRDPARLRDEASMRFLFMSVLEWHSVECPHPWRESVDGRVSVEQAYHCKMCRITWVSKEYHERRR